MTAPVLTFFNNRSGVGKTSLVYHLAWIFAMQGKRVMAIDLDPQANLTAMFLDEKTIETLWERKNAGATIYQCVRPLTEDGDLPPPEPIRVEQDLYLMPGDIALSRYEDVLSQEWLGDMQISPPFRRVMQSAAETISADIVLADVGPNLGAINRSALLATDYVIIPLTADLFSLQGLKTLGPTLRKWKLGWGKPTDRWDDSPDAHSRGHFLPPGKMAPLGYLCQQYELRPDRALQANEKWLRQIPDTYRAFVLNEPSGPQPAPQDDPYCIGFVKHYRSLIPMAQEKRKPIFGLTVADGAMGSHSQAVLAAKKDFKKLSVEIAERMGLES